MLRLSGDRDQAGEGDKSPFLQETNKPERQASLHRGLRLLLRLQGASDNLAHQSMQIVWTRNSLLRIASELMVLCCLMNVSQCADRKRGESRFVNHKKD